MSDSTTTKPVPFSVRRLLHSSLSSTSSSTCSSPSCSPSVGQSNDILADMFRTAFSVSMSPTLIPTPTPTPTPISTPTPKPPPSWTASPQDVAHIGKKRIRTIFNTEQLQQLELHFLNQHYMMQSERAQLAKSLGLHEVQVKIWFQNRRIKWRKQRQEANLEKIREFRDLSSDSIGGSRVEEAELPALSRPTNIVGRKT